MTDGSAYDAGLAALAAREWQRAAMLLEEAAADEPSAAVLEALGTAYFWTDHVATIEIRERAYREYRAARDPYGTARVAIALAWDHVNFRSEGSVARGWLQLAGRALEGRQVAAEHGHLALWEADFALSAADLATAQAKPAEALEIGCLLDDSDIELMAPPSRDWCGSCGATCGMAWGFSRRPLWPRSPARSPTRPTRATRAVT
ncbi:hypothetical protein LQ757_15215 [Agromyces sp. SYSU K20354]|uniref:hypothetical protein n=1 Tax=Agromyces cavernae TaxID=2898659 RepID=UPI001E3914A8|nr:hypothetical protein [Agromyces cavernae]MCD2443628.1 hypothetical protein [Agromyces cavernae]